ncbi:MAG: hypothetical protein JWN78_580 [Bacteroidota bacterium]|nr:hypothetical protein [Bacteroidota bacterium]
MSKSKSTQFKAVIQRATDMDVFYIPVTFDVEKTFGKKRLKVKIWYDDVLYRGLLTKYGGEYNLMMNKTIREQVGKQPGDTVNIKIEEDLDDRTVELPEILKNYFKKEKDLKAIFDGMSFTHQKEYTQWITSAKKEETLQNRLIKFKELLSAKKKK